MNSNTKTLPHNSDAENCVLGAIMLEESKFDSALEWLSPSDFYHKRHQILFETLLEERRLKRDLDLISVSEALRRTNQLEFVGGA